MEHKIKESQLKEQVLSEEASKSLTVKREAGKK